MGKKIIHFLGETSLASTHVLLMAANLPAMEAMPFRFSMSKSILNTTVNYSAMDLSNISSTLQNTSVLLEEEKGERFSRIPFML